MNTFLQRAIAFCITLIFSAVLYANTTTTRAGCMSMQGVTGNIYSMQAQLLVTAHPDSTDEMQLDWGDGNVQTEQLVNFPVTSSAHGFIVSIYITHAYPPGNYFAYLHAGKRVPFIMNIPSSDTTDFVLSCYLWVDPSFGCDGGPMSDSALLQIDMPLTLITTVTFNVADAQGDSIYWVLSYPGAAVGYTYPAVLGGGGFVLYPEDTSFEWDPQVGGLYSLFIAFADYKEYTPGNWFGLGFSSREILIDAGAVSGVNEQHVETFAVYPNPVNDLLHFSAKQEYVELLNVHGKVVLTASQTNAVDVSSLSAGVYFLRTVNGVQKVVVQ